MAPPRLDDAQQAVVSHDVGPLLVLAGPGTGKTTVANYLAACHGYEHLDGPVVRVATPDAPIPFAPALERAALPGVERIRDACRELLAY